MITLSNLHYNNYVIAQFHEKKTLHNEEYPTKRMRMAQRHYHSNQIFLNHTITIPIKYSETNHINHINRAGCLQNATNRNIAVVYVTR